MGKLRKQLGPLWGVVLDLVPFFHECCYNCQPWENEPVWLSTAHSIEDVFLDIASGVCSANGIDLNGYNSGLDCEIQIAVEEAELRCPNCGTEWEPGIDIGGEWLVARGEETANATYLLTKAFWPYITHYTKESDCQSGFDNLRQIVNERRILASSHLIKGNNSVVCLTECSPLEILELLKKGDERIGLMHMLDAPPLGAKDEYLAWKRSAHGVAIRRKAAIDAGALPVIHGDVDLWNALPEKDRFRYQRFDRLTTYSDWTYEREFRFEGDVDLTKFSPTDVLIVVADRKEQFSMLAQVDVPPCSIMPLDFVFSREDPHPRRTDRQKARGW